MIKAKWSAPGEEYSQAAQVRLAVFVAEQGYPKDLETLSPGVLKPGRIAVLREYRKQHLGARLMEELLKKAEELGARELHIGAQVQAQGFYEKFGFHTCGEPVYMDVHIPHVDMVRHLSGEA